MLLLLVGMLAALGVSLLLAFVAEAIHSVAVGWYDGG
jgi:hypothetical protein